MVVGETRDMAHAAEMVRVLKDRYTNLTFTGHEGALGLTIETESSDENEGDLHDNCIAATNSLGIPGGGRRRRSSIRRLSIQTTNVV